MLSASATTTFVSHRTTRSLMPVEEDFASHGTTHSSTRVPDDFGDEEVVALFNVGNMISGVSCLEARSRNPSPEEEAVDDYTD